MTEDQGGQKVPLSRLEPEQKAARAASFGGVASHYERYRPGPTPAAVEWLIPLPAARVVDLGAGTGALTRLLTERADEVVAVEPDDRMREVLTKEVPRARAVKGRGESIPIPDDCAEAVVASSSWHWMDVLPTLAEVRRVLVPGGTLGVIQSGPDPEGAFIVQARAILAERVRADQAAGTSGGMADLVMADADRPVSILEIPPGTGFAQPEHRAFGRVIPLTADDLVGLLGTFSSFITMDEDTRSRVFAEARRLLSEYLGVEGAVTVDVEFRTEVWRSRLGS